MLKKTIILFILCFAGLQSYGQINVTLDLPKPCYNTSIDKFTTNKKAVSLVVTPNPSKGKISLKLSSTSPLESFSVFIYDTNSKVIYSDLFYCPDINFIKQVNLSNQADGIYIVSIFNNTYRISRKIIIKK